MVDQKVRLDLHALVANELEKHDAEITKEKCFRVTGSSIAKRFPEIIRINLYMSEANKINPHRDKLHFALASMRSGY